LFSEEIWADVITFFDPEDGTPDSYTAFEDSEIELLASKGLEQLSSSEIHRLNFRLVLNALDHTEWLNPSFFSGVRYSAGMFISQWMEDLLEVATRTKRPHGVPDSIPHHWNPALISRPNLVRPNGILYSFTPNTGVSQDTDASVARIAHPCFGAGILTAVQPPRQLSSGFHQVFPIIVQLALMKTGELLGVENPEVHLHPGLHLRLIEALLSQVESGRRFVLETHSDLAIRRTIRAILAEEIPQAAVQIYFADLDDQRQIAYGDMSIAFHGSTLTPIQIDADGRIANWPNGFLDDDTRESKRLLDIMYGRTAPNDSE
jgi:hypothetical protein